MIKKMGICEEGFNSNIFLLKNKIFLSADILMNSFSMFCSIFLFLLVINELKRKYRRNELYAIDLSKYILCISIYDFLFEICIIIEDFFYMFKVLDVEHCHLKTQKILNTIMIMGFFFNFFF